MVTGNRSGNDIGKLERSLRPCRGGKGSSLLPRVALRIACRQSCAPPVATILSPFGAGTTRRPLVFAPAAQRGGGLWPARLFRQRQFLGPRRAGQPQETRRAQARLRSLRAWQRHAGPFHRRRHPRGRSHRMGQDDAAQARPDVRVREQELPGGRLAGRYLCRHLRRYRWRRFAGRGDTHAGREGAQAGDLFQQERALRCQAGQDRRSARDGAGHESPDRPSHGRKSRRLSRFHRIRRRAAVGRPCRRAGMAYRSRRRRGSVPQPSPPTGP
jgi:hypothetical protein